ncbi:interleukin-1 receptor accessory protein-like 1-A [Apostichopus japonicus]|uniref:interleukin-1 receptor accessory protein-like 1-A n=1 Tax=Stichopus japonicus TaxID=307972 RepID=UPI003AB8349D
MMRVSIVFLYFVFGTSLVNSQRYTNESCEIRRYSELHEGLTLAKELVEETAQLGDNVTLCCLFHNYCAIQWYHRGNVLQPSADGRVQFLDGDQYLQINDVMPEDIGEYSCTVFNYTNQVTYQGFLTIEGIKFTELAITHHHLDTRTSINDDVTLSCDVANQDQVTWYHNGKLITSGRENYYIQSSNSNHRLVIQLINLKHQGAYTCVASNSTHNVSRTGHVSVSCFDTEDVILVNCSTGVNVTAALGSDLNMECIFYLGYSRTLALAYWYKVNESATQDLFDSTWWYSPEFLDLEGAKVNITVVDTQKVEEGDCLRTEFYVTIGMSITNVTKEVFGHYIALAYKNTNWNPNLFYISEEPATPNIIKVPVVVSTAGICFLIFTLIFFTWKIFHLDIKLFFRDVNHYFNGWKEETDGKLYDVYIACSENDVQFVLRTFLPLLKEEGYTTCLPVIDFLPGDSSHESIWNSVKASRCCLLIVSRGMLSCTDIIRTEMQAATYIFSDRKHGVIPVLFDEVPDVVMNQSHVLKHFVSNNPKLILKKKDYLNVRTLRKSSVFKRMRLAFPYPSEKTFARKVEASLVQQEIQPTVEGPHIVMNSLKIENNPKTPQILSLNNNDWHDVCLDCVTGLD